MAKAEDNRPLARRRFSEAPRKGELRRLEILDAAEEQLRDHSLLDLTIEQLADIVGVSRSSVYFYFGNKWAVVDALVDRASAEMLEHFERIADDVGLDDYVDATIEATVDGWRAHRVVFLAAAERSSHADESTGRWRAIMHEFVELMASRIALEPGAASPEEVARMAEICSWMVERNFYMLFSRKHDAAAEQSLIEGLQRAMKRILRPA